MPFFTVFPLLHIPKRRQHHPKLNMAQRVRYSEDGLLHSRVGSPQILSTDTQALISEGHTPRFYDKSRRPRRLCCRSFWAVVMPWIVAFISIGTAAYLYRQLQTKHSRDSVELPYSKRESLFILCQAINRYNTQNPRKLVTDVCNSI